MKNKGTRDKAMIGALIGGVAGIAGSLIAANKQKKADAALLKQNQIAENNAATLQAAQAMSAGYANQDYVDEYNKKITLKMGGKSGFRDRFKGGGVKMSKEDKYYIEHPYTNDIYGDAVRKRIRKDNVILKNKIKDPKGRHYREEYDRDRHETNEFNIVGAKYPKVPQGDANKDIVTTQDDIPAPELKKAAKDNIKKNIGNFNLRYNFGGRPKKDWGGKDLRLMSDGTAVQASSGKDPLGYNVGFLTGPGYGNNNKSKKPVAKKTVIKKRSKKDFGGEATDALSGVGSLVSSLFASSKPPKQVVKSTPMTMSAPKTTLNTPDYNVPTTTPALDTNNGRFQTFRRGGKSKKVCR
jgi:hypothetical protein